MKQNRFLSYFTQRLKLSARRVSTASEVWHIFVSRGGLIFFSLFIIGAIAVGVFFLIGYTPALLEKLPGYMGQDDREELVISILKLDSLQQEVERWDRYTANLSAVLDGKKIETIISDNDSIKGKTKAEITPLSLEDSLLRASVEEVDYQSSSQRRNFELSFAMIAPIEGNIISPFMSPSYPLGVIVASKPSTVVLSVMEGTVIFSDWTPSEGYVVVVQHAASMMSVYKKLDQVLKTQGTRVKAGEGIGITKATKEAISPEIKFELWNEGNAVDPENYITFTPAVIEN